MRPIDAGNAARSCLGICHREPCRTRQPTLDGDEKVQKNTRNVVHTLLHTLVHAVQELRAGPLSQPEAGLQGPRPK